MAPFMQNGSEFKDLPSSTTPDKPKPSTLASLVTSVQADLWSQAHRIPADLRTLRELSQAGLNGGLIDDRKYIVENVIQAASSLPNTSGLRTRITDTFIASLWNNVQHPPMSYLGDESWYRRADGSCNNIIYPHLGASGSQYARLVTPKHPRSVALPDPGLIFDTLLAREGPAKQHPTSISSNLFYFATIIQHDIYLTDETNPTCLKSSSYLDLGPLYGNNQAEQTEVRTFTDGLLKPDTFAEKRLLSQPPGVCALMIAFNRFHNYIVTELARINEAGRFNLPCADVEKAPEYTWALQKRDEDLFQMGRLITCALYVSIILNDYLRTILNLNDNPFNSDWKLDPRKSLSVFDSEGIPRGIGNQVSAEFNMMYHWHAAISNQDEQWINELSSSIFGPKVDSSTLSVERYLGGLRKYFEKSVPVEPSRWTFGDLKRQRDGRFANQELVDILNEGTENIAGALGVHNTPKVMRAIEMLSIQRGREWGLATLNELRTFFKLKPHSTFLEVNSDTETAEALEALYGHPDNIELYVGVQAEEAKTPFKPGSGLCAGFTTSMAILSDAVALVRGDRFYTTDYSPANLTSFGFQIAESDFDIANGGLMYKLLMRAFPGCYSANNVYALYPFTAPTRVGEIFSKYKGRAERLEYMRPMLTRPPVQVSTWNGVFDLLKERGRFCGIWGERASHLSKYGYMLNGDSAPYAEQRRFMAERLYRPVDAIEQVRRFYESITTDLLRRHSRKLGGSYQIDIVKDVANLAHAYFCADFFNIPLKSNRSSNNDKLSADAYTARDLANALSAIYNYLFLDKDATQSNKSRILAKDAAARLGSVVKKAMSQSPGTTLFTSAGRIFGKDTNRPLLHGYGPQLIKRLQEGGRDINETVWMIVVTAAMACSAQAMGWSQLLDLYLSDRYAHHWPAIRSLAQSDDPEAFDKLKKYALEGLRLAPPTPGTLRKAKRTSNLHDGPTTHSIPKDTLIFASFVSAGLDPSKFPEPRKVMLNRPVEAYIQYGGGQHSCLGRAIVTTAAAVMLRVFGRLGHLRRCEGATGELKSKPVEGVGEGDIRMFLDADGKEWTGMPCNKKVMFDTMEALGGKADGAKVD
ncbi:heme peroxidase [Aspergillus venezuelensis]